MNAKLSKIIAGLGTVLALGAYASTAGAMTVTRMGDDQFKAIHAGLTQDQVRSDLGTPARVLPNERPGITMWTYNYTDSFGYVAEFDVNFDASGKVTSTDSLRPKF